MQRQRSDPGSDAPHNAVGRRGSELHRQRSEPVNDAPLSAKSAATSKKPKKTSSKKNRKFSKLGTVAVGDHTQTPHGDDDFAGPDEEDVAATSAFKNVLAAVGNFTMSFRSSFGLGSLSTSSRDSEDARSTAGTTSGTTSVATAGITSVTTTDSSNSVTCDTISSATDLELPFDDEQATAGLIMADAAVEVSLNSEDAAVTGAAVTDAVAAAPQPATGTPRHRVVRLLSQLRMSFAVSSDSQQQSPTFSGGSSADAAAPSPVHQQGPYPLVQMVMSSFGAIGVNMSSKQARRVDN